MNRIVLSAVTGLIFSASGAVSATLTVLPITQGGVAEVVASSSQSAGMLDSTVGTSDTRASVSLNDGLASVNANWNTGTIAFESFSDATENATSGSGGNATISYAFDVQNSGVPLPAGLFELTIDGTFSGSLPDPLTLQSAFGSIGVTLQVPGPDSQITIGGSVDPFFGVTVSGTQRLGTVDFNATGGAFEATLLSGTVILGDPQFLPAIRLAAGANIGFSNTSTNGGSFAISSLNTASFRINPNLGVTVVGAPSGILTSQNMTPVPVPASMPMLLSGFALCAWVGRRMTTRTKPTA